ncbi:MAG: hypothetical protein K0S11_846 [Gammaproteobacteria bacterium]|jgi:pimeloyl-ACP methyl ester carboxylesterase|nr:hypothetical protein [Gammaproteobacteria bacterium]
MALSRVLYSYAWIRGDFPGPKYLTNQPPASRQIDWLLLHGASLDARMWKNIVNHCPNQRILAVSLANHNLSTKLAQPGHEPSQEIIKLLKQYKVKQGIITHSSGAVWLANAYAECPRCFNNLTINLLVPNFCYLQVSKLERLLMDILPSIAWEGLTVDSCVNSSDYEQCKRDYLFGRRYYVSNLNYFNNLLNLCTRPETQENIHQFVTHLAGQGHYILADGDVLIDNDKLQAFLVPYHSQLTILPHTSHHEAYKYAANIMHCKA